MAKRVKRKAGKIKTPRLKALEEENKDLREELEELRAATRVKIREWLQDVAKAEGRVLKKENEVMQQAIRIQMLERRVQNLNAELNQRGATRSPSVTTMADIQELERLKKELDQ